MDSAHSGYCQGSGEMMNTVEARSRILRHLAVIRHQVDLQNRNNQQIADYCETAAQDALNAAFGWRLQNLNGTTFNQPAIDLQSANKRIGVQVTNHVTKKKYDDTLDSLLLARQTNPDLEKIKEVYVVGMTCVDNADITLWKPVSAAPHIKAIALPLEKALNLSNRTPAQIGRIDKAMQDLAYTTPAFSRTDKDELELHLIPALNRAAITDTHTIEVDWTRLLTAMADIRRLLCQGANPSGHVVTRPLTTFQPDAKNKLTEILRSTNAISGIVKRGITPATGQLSQGDGLLVDGYRKKIREVASDLCTEAGIIVPAWSLTATASPGSCPTCGQALP